MTAALRCPPPFWTSQAAGRPLDRRRRVCAVALGKMNPGVRGKISPPW